MKSSEPFFNKVTIIGVGLMGGSLALAGKKAGLFGQVVGCGRTEESLVRAVELNVIDKYIMQCEQAVTGADLVVVATPVLYMREIFQKISAHLKPGCIVFDLGSIKKKIVRWAESELQNNCTFIGVHPIAGTERSGVEASSEKLYQGAWCVLTPGEKTDAEALIKVTWLWEKIGSKTTTMSVDEHDQVLAAISHLPHMVAYALVNTVSRLDKENGGGVLSFSAGGFKDFTRIASSHPVMWKDICMGNKECVVDMIERFEAELANIKSYINNEDQQSLQKEFQEARDARNSLL